VAIAGSVEQATRQSWADVPVSKRQTGEMELKNGCRADVPRGSRFKRLY